MASSPTGRISPGRSSGSGAGPDSLASCASEIDFGHRGGKVMRVKLIVSAVCGVTLLAVTLVAQQAGQAPATQQGQPQAAAEVPDDVRTLVTRFELEKFKAT